MDSQDSASPTPASQEELDRQEAIRISDGEAASNDAVPRPTPPSEDPCVPDTPLTLTVVKPDAIVAGGWDQTYNNNAGGYYYLSKEESDKKNPDPWVKRDREVDSVDPHVVTLTATVGGGDGSLEGHTVTFHCDMPGPDPEQTVTGTTDAGGVAKAAIISGDELSRDTDDETGQQLFDEPVKIDVTCGDAEKSTSVDVLAPTIEWKYKDDNGNYSHWTGETYDIYDKPSYHSGIPLQTVLMFNNVPVFGHRVSWSIDHVYDEAGEEVKPDNEEFASYGHMSGPISTTTQQGAATANFKHSYSFGRLDFDFTDASVFTRHYSPESPPTRLPDGVAAAPAAAPAATPTPTPTPSGWKVYDKKLKKYFYKTIQVGEYKFVKGKPLSDNGLPIDSISNRRAYPAPSGAEDEELWIQTRNDAKEVMVPSKESRTGSRMQNPGEDIVSYGNGDPYLQSGYWWFSQCVGNDEESYGTHLADFKVPFLDAKKKKRYHYYSGAFDIVLTKVPIFQDLRPRESKTTFDKDGKPHTVTTILNQGVPAFGSAVKSMRDHGIVAWHRWAKESSSTSENEMHCIDPATPFLKDYLSFQVDDFRFRRGTGSKSGGYPAEPLIGPFAITRSQIKQVNNRLAAKLSIRGAVPDNIKP